MQNKNSQKIKAVLFDIDGVLVDSFAAGVQFTRDILKQLGHPEPTLRAHRKAFHLPLKPALAFLAKAELTEAFERLHEILPNVYYHSELLAEPPYTKEMLEELSHTYTLGLITSRNREGLMKRYFPFSHTKKYFSVCITVEDVTHHKPHPEGLLLAAKRLKLPPSACVYVGDSHTDVEAGKAAGMKTVLYGKKKNKDADIHARSFKRLPELIAKLEL